MVAPEQLQAHMTPYSSTVELLHPSGVVKNLEVLQDQCARNRCMRERCLSRIVGSSCALASQIHSAFN